jgi:pimeloyl-ACP methyl ester carboxylesterase
MPFEIYFTFRDLWFDRWIYIKNNDLEILKVKINVNGGFIHANLAISKNKRAVEKKKSIILVSGGFSDKKETLQFYYLPLAYQGYIILAYDARGIGESKKLGHRANLLKRIEDFKKIVEWVSNHEEYQYYKIYALGISIGASTVLCGGFTLKKIKKIVAISSMSNYKKTISEANAIIKFSYFMKGLNFSPDDELNHKISPYLMIEQAKGNLSQPEWKKLSQRIMLIHSKNDKIIPFNNFEENRALLELPDENQLIFDKGGHMLKKNELALVGATLNFLKS